MTRPLDSELHRFADGRLSGKRAAEVQFWLDCHPDDAALVADWQKQKEMLHQAYDQFSFVQPEEVRSSSSDRRFVSAGRWLAPRMATLFICITFGVVIGYLLRGVMSSQQSGLAASLPRQAVIAHAVYSPEIRHPVEVDVTQEKHLAQWLSKRLGGELSIPNLTSSGYKLLGGRLLPSETGPAAQFMYENQNGLRLTLYVRKSAQHDATAFRFVDEGKLSVFYWIDGAFGYALSGELPRDALLTVANNVYRQIGGR